MVTSNPSNLYSPNLTYLIQATFNMHKSCIVYRTSPIQQKKGISLFYSLLQQKRVFTKYSSHLLWEKDLQCSFTDNTWHTACKANQLLNAPPYGNYRSKLPCIGILHLWYYPNLIPKPQTHVGDFVMQKGTCYISYGVAPNLPPIGLIFSI